MYILIVVNLKEKNTSICIRAEIVKEGNCHNSYRRIDSQAVANMSRTINSQYPRSLNQFSNLPTVRECDRQKRKFAKPRRIFKQEKQEEARKRRIRQC